MHSLVLEQTGLPVRVVDSAQDVLDVLHSGLHDVAVVDVAFAGGTASVSQLLERAPGVRIIAMATAAAAHEGVNTVRISAVDFIHRPPDREGRLRRSPGQFADAMVCRFAAAGSPGRRKVGRILGFRRKANTGAFRRCGARP